MTIEREKTFEELLEEELESRISEIESPDYEHVPRLQKKDYLGMIATAVVCVIIIAIGII